LTHAFTPSLVRITAHRYSDVLYVKESRAELSQLAHIAARNDKYRPETCCIIGNYYSLKGQHERAVLYFQRALRLNRKFLFAWRIAGPWTSTPAIIGRGTG
ncbi:cell division cycle protein 23, partial [Nannochloropsis gaditana CCMP526]|uniref:cell division cycle protein 23 n=1 Tax=Nannochloropsis gaditana (strain CCMP526) TaxID=1093141 RepID=UPI00029F54F1